MSSYINFKNFSNTMLPQGNGGRPTGAFPLTRQSSVYSLTFDELQNTLGGHGKDFGSMNMDELLKNIWTAEETQAMACSTVGEQGSVHGGNLQRQGSLTLPRTLSQKTVDEVWRDLLKESGNGGPNLQQRQPSLGEMTLEEFLVRSGVVTEDNQPIGNSKNGGFYGGPPGPSNNNTGYSLGFQQSVHNNRVLDNRTTQNNSIVPNQPQPLLPKQTTVAFASPLHLVNNARVSDPPMNNSLVQGGLIQSGAMGMAGLDSGTTSDGTPKGNINTSSLSPFQYMYSEIGRGRNVGGALEKVQERRHKRMIKNRESAARSRARKQAYTFELEAELEKLKEINRELKKKQAEIREIQKHESLETEKLPWGSKRQCLRRTRTPPW